MRDDGITFLLYLANKIFLIGKETTIILLDAEKFTYSFIYSSDYLKKCKLVFERFRCHGLQTFSLLSIIQEGGHRRLY